MRGRRLKLSGMDAVYHCMTRTVNGERLFGRVEREVLRRMLWACADFSGVKVITYCLMENHFHVLVRVPAEREVSDAELVRRFRVLYPRPTPYQLVSPEHLEGLLAAGGADAEKMRESLLRRMGDVSEFMKTLKHRFSVWFNKTKGRFGPLWAERFKSVLVEGGGYALKTVAAYIDLNPVRAGIVDDPKDYRFSGYGEAVAGGAAAREGIGLVGGDLPAYRMLLYGKGSAPGEGAALPSRARARVVDQEMGEISLPRALLCRVRYFTDGKILGSRRFVEELRSSKGVAVGGGCFAGLFAATRVRERTTDPPGG
ncbi:MAG: transposase [Puniceicoccaceae bacterium]